ncbi:MAG: type II toxin-antitoxin system PemK/MazF family toxin [Acidobacteria bacterium]|nr:type II toxin-antitoxin system PemK/MazF family toxin [Acidobacteriota bacterium]
MTCEPWDVVVVPFPFTDRPETRRRPALVVSQPAFNSRGHTVLAMITSAAQAGWPGDSPIGDLASAGLSRPCIVRLKLFTLDNRFILKKAGRLSETERAGVARQIATWIFGSTGAC